ncbi:MAG: OPT/YSL family transporter [Sandaracinaceae bacterium]
MSERGSGYREVTVSAVVLGVFQGALMTAAFVYIGLKLGFGLAGSTVAAIMGFALLRGVGRNVFKIPGAGSIVENNINQTIASGINTASAGVVFTFPALLLLDEDIVGEYELWPILLAAIAGSFMGIVIIIPLRKQIIEIERLRFPSGIAVATILKSPGAGPKKALYLAAGFVFALTITLLTNFEVLPETLQIGEWIRNGFGISSRGAGAFALVSTALSLSMANIGAGLLSGKGGLPFALGGILAFWIIGPAVVEAGWAPAAGGMELWGAVYGTMLRPVGIGILIGGALAGVIAAFPAIRGAFRSLSSASKLAREGGGTAEELPPKVLIVGLCLAFLALLAVATTDAHTADGSIDWGVALLVAVAGTIWLGLAGLIVAQATGATDISPLSGLALIAVTLMLGLSGGNVLLAVTVGVAVCIATNQCADMMSDLKTGHLIGGVPRRQQLVQFGVAWIGPAIAIGTTLLLWADGPGGENGFGPDSPACQEQGAGCLPAPQAAVLQSMVESVLSGDSPVDKYLSGAVIGGALALFPVGGLGVLIGLAMYLPFEITLGYGIGCAIHMGLAKWKGKRFIGDVLVPIAAGLIVGEALTSLTLTLIRLASGGGGH